MMKKLFTVKSRPLITLFLAGMLFYAGAPGFVSFSSAQSILWSAMVVGVQSGDTITIKHKGKRHKIKLYGIDAPEKKQDFGTKAKRFTYAQIFRKHVHILLMGESGGSQKLGIVSLENEDILNQKLVEAGLAWVDGPYCKLKMCNEWRLLMMNAKSRKIGLWSKPYPTPPWMFRERKGQ
jgi:endonuclease YncB( thermonuclease family)